MDYAAKETASSELVAEGVPTSPWMAEKLLRCQGGKNLSGMPEKPFMKGDRLTGYTLLRSFPREMDARGEARNCSQALRRSHTADAGEAVHCWIPAREKLHTPARSKKIHLWNPQRNPFLLQDPSSTLY